MPFEPLCRPEETENAYRLLDLTRNPPAQVASVLNSLTPVTFAPPSRHFALSIRSSVYELARYDLTVSAEDTIKNLHRLQGEGLFEHIALSEVGAETMHTAARTARELGTHIVSVELEYSPFMAEIEDNGVHDACKEHGIPILSQQFK
ncbi:hypothetical protein OC834_006866 [Tilletia horrida]|nr:hypothetical protein OC834_006866 [Tilletia horrida]